MSEADRSSEPPGSAPGQPGRADPPGRPSLRGNRPSEEVLPTVVREVVEEMHMALRSGPMPNPILEKITPEQIGRLLDAEERDREREQERYKLRIEERKEQNQLRAERQKFLLESRAQKDRWQIICLSSIAVLILLLVFGLCWLFLTHGQAQYIVTVLSSLFAFAGGIGVGRWSAPRPDGLPKEDKESAKQQE